MLETAAVLVPGLPLLAALWIALGWATGRNRGEAGERVTARAALVGTGSALAVLLILDLAALWEGPAGQVVAGEWLAAGGYRVHLSFTLDPLALSAATLTALLCLLTLHFAIGYMHREAGFQRFFGLLSLFTAAMLLLVTSGNAVLTFAGWELAGLCSYLLIGYAYDRPMATGNAVRALVANRIGEAGFLLSIALAFQWTGGVEWPGVLSAATGFETLAAGVLGGGLLLAATAKSAQVPFAPWLGRALEGPTPSSALFYGAVMVHAGVYLVIRIEPIIVEVPALGVFLAVTGALTALYGFLGGLLQADVKSGLAFSVTAQVGLMFLACGLGWFELAGWHMGAHAAWRAYQFLSAPGYLHLVSRPARPVPAWLARRRGLYTATLRRFWLDPIADWLLVEPVRALASETQAFDARVVSRVIGLPSEVGAPASLAEWEAQGEGRAVGADLGEARGAAGRLMAWLARTLGWLEDRLVMQRGGAGAGAVLRRVGEYLLHIDDLFSQPRYLFLIIVVSLVVVLS